MILIVGSTGVLGREATRQLLAANYQVRAMTRDPDKAADLQQIGAEVVQGDLIDYGSLRRACEGVEQVLAAAHSLMGKGRYTSQAVDDAGYHALIDAAKEAGVQKFVYLSMQGASSDHPVDFLRTKAKIERYLKASGLSYTILRSPAYMEWHVHTLLGKAILETGKTTIFGKGDNPLNFIAGRDIARYAILALTNSRMKGETLEVGGLDNFSKNQVAEMYSRYSGLTPKLSHVPTGMMRFMAPLIRPFEPVISRLMSISVWTDTTDQTFDPSAILKEYPMSLIRLEDFVRERVEESMRLPDVIERRAID